MAQIILSQIKQYFQGAKSILSDWVKKPAIFWLSLGTLNLLFFITDYLHTKNLSLLFPFQGFQSAEGITDKLNWIFFRDTMDVWRINLDFFLLVIVSSIIIRFWKGGSRLLIWIVPVIYTLFLFYSIYESTIYQLYYRNADLLHDYFLIINGFLIVINEGWMLSLLIVGLSVYCLIIYLLFRAVFSHQLIQEFHKSRVTIFILAVSVVSIILFGYSSKYNSLTLTASRINLNIENSIRHRGYREIEFKKIKEANSSYANHELEHKPNVFLLFVESYGQIALQVDSLSNRYNETIATTDSLFEAAKIYSTSNLSIAPVSGGSSWISFSSALYGFHIKHHSLFNYMINNPDIESCLNLNRWLQQQGYDGSFISPFKPKNYHVPVEKYKRYYALQNWIDYQHYEDYKGYRYGWNSPPNDQYVLNYAYEYMKRKSESPKTLFFMTKNSHYPWDSPKRAVPDWRSLKVKSGERLPYAKPTIPNYIDAISFQIEFISQFIMKEANQTDIFIVIGDHQPPKLISKVDSFETPIHIISKDSSFINSFQEYGFYPSLAISQPQPVRHEALLSMLIREMVRSYGKNPEHLPPYLANGIE